MRGKINLNRVRADNSRLVTQLATMFIFLSSGAKKRERTQHQYHAPPSSGVISPRPSPLRLRFGFSDDDSHHHKLTWPDPVVCIPVLHLRRDIDITNLVLLAILIIDIGVQRHRRCRLPARQ